MDAVFKILSSVLTLLAVVACLAAAGVIVYSIFRPDLSGVVDTLVAAESSESPSPDASPSEDPSASADPNPSPDPTATHVHQYVESVEIEVTCTTNGRLLFMCACGDHYYEEIPATGHTPGDWELMLAPTETAPGLRIQRCTRCNLTLATEVVPATVPTPDPNVSPTPTPTPHVHSYVAAVESYATCTVAGTRRFTCETCDSYYTENIMANGHLPGDWEITVAPTVEKTGSRQRICTVCYTLVDIRQIAKLPDPDNLPAGSPEPTLDPNHTHTFTYVTTLQPDCTSTGARTGRCVCGAETQALVERDTSKHSFSTGARNIKAGTCIRCGAAQSSSSASPTPTTRPN
jgi:hypothetical protein